MKIYVVNIHEYLPLQGGESLLDIYRRVAPRIPFRPICARVNNKTENLGFPVFSPKQIEFIDATTPSGSRVYTRSLCMLLYKAVHDVAPGQTLSIEHSISRGYYCRLLNPEHHAVASVTLPLIERIRDRMRELVEEDIPFMRRERLTKDVIELFREQGLLDKVRLLETVHELYTTYYELDGLADSYYGPLAPSTSHLSVFDLQPYAEGFLLLGPDPANLAAPASPLTQEKMYHAFTDYLRFNNVIQVSCVAELNRVVTSRRVPDLINVAEAMHDKLLGRISDDIAARYREGGARVVLIAGPSSSGKTTSSKRLAIQLSTNLMKPKVISLDDYFVDREHTPRDIDGGLDYESLYALDLERLNDDLNKLLRGEEINLPTYSFELGKRVEKRRPMRLEKNEILLMEGIHGLNPELTSQISPDEIFKVYVSALTTLKIDDHNWISTTDNRLLRRIVRDAKYRHTSALDTIRRWGSVRRGEEKWIFPYQENADATFNSSLIFEIGVMKEYAEPVLREVPHDVPEYAESYRLLKFLSYFEPITSSMIPHTSLLREFLGGSSFHY